MMVTVFLRIAKRGRPYKGSMYKVTGSSKPTSDPLTIDGIPAPTVSFALDIDIPESKFKEQERVIAQIKLPENTEITPGEVHYIDMEY